METVVRVFIIYVFLLVALRIIGKREFGQLSPFELVTLLIIPEIVSEALTFDDYSLTNALIGVATLLVLVFLASNLMHLSERFEMLAIGEPTVLVDHGKLVVGIMNKERVSPDEVFTAMHKSGLEALEQVQWAILETDGEIAIIPVPAVQGDTGRTQDDMPL